MAKNRYINTKFWSDNFIVNLNPLERYLFLYFLTNEHTNICGIYELPLRTIAFETGIDEEMLVKMLARLKGKIYWIDGWVYLKNFTKHQAENTSVKEGVKRAIEDVPNEIMAKIKDIQDEGVQPVTACPPPPTYLTKPNLTTLNPNRGDGVPPPLTPKEKAIKFFLMVQENETEFALFVEHLSRDTGLPADLCNSEVKKFTSFWTELTLSGKKQRWEKQEAFEVKRRLATWLGKMKQSYKPKTGKQIL